MRKKFFAIVVLLFLAGSFFSCHKEEKDTLTETKWKLVGFVDVETDTIKEVNPSPLCFVLTFTKWGKFSGHSAVNSMEGKYKINYSKHNINLSVGLMTAVGCLDCDEDLYIECLGKVDSFSVQKNELKLYYNNKQNYLLYKPQH